MESTIKKPNFRALIQESNTTLSESYTEERAKKGQAKKTKPKKGIRQVYSLYNNHKQLLK